MSAKDFKEKYLNYIETWNKKDIEKMDRLTDELISVDIIWHFPGGEIGQGTEGQKAFIRESIEKNPDLHVTIDDLLFDGDKMIVRATSLMNNPATGAVESIVWLEIDRFTGDKWVECWTLAVPGQW